MSILLSIFLGGGLGALLRFLISEQTNRLFLSSFPFGTIVVNVLGAFLMGFVVSYFADKVNVSQNIKNVFNNWSFRRFHDLFNFKFGFLSFI